MIADLERSIMFFQIKSRASYVFLRLALFLQFDVVIYDIHFLNDQNLDWPLIPGHWYSHNRPKLVVACYVPTLI